MVSKPSNRLGDQRALVHEMMNAGLKNPVVFAEMYQHGKDINGDRVIDSKDMVPDSYTIIPEMIPTFNFGFEYKGFDARMIVNAYLRRSVFLSPAISYSQLMNNHYQRVIETAAKHHIMLQFLLLMQFPYFPPFCRLAACQ